MVREIYWRNWWDHAVYTHFIERPENLQGTAECAMRVNSLVVIQLEHNLGLALRLCTFRRHHLLKAVFDRHEYERKSTEIQHSQGRLGQGNHIYPSDEFIR